VQLRALCRPSRRGGLVSAPWHVEETSTGWWLVKADGFRITMIDERFAREAAAFYNRVTDLGYDMVRTPPMTASWHDL
jgi:hypothetical protein